MLLARSLSTGLFGACLYLLMSVHPPSWSLHDPRVHVHQHPRIEPRSHAGPAVALVDVAPGVTGDQLPGLLHLRRGEHVLAVDDRVVADDLAAGALLAERAANADHRSYIDLTVGAAGDVAAEPGQHRERRVLVLLR